MSKNKKYSFETLTEVYKVEDDLKTRLKNRVGEMERNGFYLDLRVNEIGETILDVIRKSFCDPNGRRYDPAYRIEDDFEILRKYTMSGEGHVFVHVKPYNFSFRYVDFHNMHSVFNTSNSIITYANSFWGIYIRNDHLRLHDLVQYDIFQKYFDIKPYNIYDGGNDLLHYSDVCNYLGLGGRHEGAIFTGWQDFIDTRKSMIDNEIRASKAKVENLLTQIKDENDHLIRYITGLQSEIEQLTKLA